MDQFIKIIVSFVNKSFEIGEWLIDEDLINSDDIDELSSAIILGIPCLAILHCIEKSSNFDDDCIYLATTDKISSDQINNIEIKKIIDLLLRGKKIYRTIPFSCTTYNIFKKNIILKIKDNYEFVGIEKQLFNILFEVSLNITQIQEYKLKFNNVVSLLGSFKFS